MKKTAITLCAVALAASTFSTAPAQAARPRQGTVAPPPAAFVAGAMKYSHLTRAQTVSAWNDPVKRAATIVAVTLDHGSRTKPSPRGARSAWRARYAWARMTFRDFLGRRAWFQVRLDWIYNGSRVANPVVTTSHDTTVMGRCMGSYDGLIDSEGGYRFWKGSTYRSYVAKRTGHWQGLLDGPGFDITASVRGYYKGGYSISGKIDK